MTQKIKVLITEKLDEEALNCLKENPKFLVIEDNLDKIKDFDVLLIRSQTKVTKEVIEKAQNLKIIGRAGVGLDNIDLIAAQNKNIKVINSPKGNSVATAEFTFGLILSLLRHIPSSVNHLKEGLWQRSLFMGEELLGKTLGIIGYGNVGQKVSKIAHGFDMKVIFYDPFFKESVNLEYLLQNSDIITLHTILNEQTKFIINKDNIYKTKKSAYIINAARGELIDNNALLESLNNNHLSGVALDVYKKEPPDKDELLLNHPKILATPHLGASSKEAQKKVAIELVQQLEKLF